MNYSELADAARNGISSYCMEECGAYCCQKGYLMLTESEKDLIIGDREEEFISREILKPIGPNEYAYFMGEPGQPCLKLNGVKCSIHKNPGRPATCGKFPVFIDGKSVKFSGRCPAVRNGKTYPYEKQFIMMGFTITKEN